MKNWGKLGSVLGTAAGRDTGGTLGKAAGRDTLEHAGVRCGAGYGGSRWGPLQGNWGNLRRNTNIY